jgi:hypothetical protein
MHAFKSIVRGGNDRLATPASSPRDPRASRSKAVAWLEQTFVEALRGDD